MPIRIKRSFFHFKLNVIIEIRLLAKSDFCTIVTIRNMQLVTAKPSSSFFQLVALLKCLELDILIALFLHLT